MCLPQLRRLRIEGRARVVGKRLQRPMLKPACFFESAASGYAIGEDDPPGYDRKSDNDSSAGAEQQGSMEWTRQKWQQIEQAKDKKAGKHGERRPASGPDPLPQQCRAGEAEPRQERSVWVG